jgi:hypothetical protein
MEKQTLVLRDAEGNTYAIPADVLASYKVAETEVAGYGFFFSPDIQNAFTNLSQNNTNVGSNLVIGGFIGQNNQNLTQLGVNSANVQTGQVH